MPDIHWMRCTFVNTTRAEVDAWIAKNGMSKTCPEDDCGEPVTAMIAVRGTGAESHLMSAMAVCGEHELGWLDRLGMIPPE